MNIFKMIFRDRQTISVDSVELWQVRWKSRHGRWEDDVRPEIRSFTSESAANEFAQALTDAFALIKHTSGNKVVIEKVERH